MQKLNEYADRVVLLLLVLGFIGLVLFTGKLSAKVTELSHAQVSVQAVPTVEPSATATPSATVAPTKVLLKSAPVVTKAVVK